MSAGTTRLPSRTRRTSTLASAVGLAVLSLGAGAAAGSGGGIGVSDPPEVSDVVCTDRCLDVRTVTETGRVEISGKNLRSIESVRFPAQDGRIAVEPRSTSATSVISKVPVGAMSGRPSVVDEFGSKAASPVELKVRPEDAIESVEGFEVTKAKASPRKSFFNGKRESEVDYLFEADGPADVRIDVIEKKGGEVVDSIVKPHQKPFAAHSVTWDGLGTKNKVAANGKYRFKVSAASGGPGAGAGFSYYDHIFPLRGEHGYGDGLGAGRGHQGQDVFAKCGTKIVAARGGRVQTKAYQSAAGYYIVIDGRKTGNDYVYMHMAKQGRIKKSARVRTGDVIGYESDTGHATGCHLHFELWSAPGWYEGGHVLDPTKPLKKWDDWS